MELKDFVKETLNQILDGIASAQESELGENINAAHAFSESGNLFKVNLEHSRALILKWQSLRKVRKKEKPRSPYGALEAVAVYQKRKQRQSDKI
ncbi:hypothetical protein HED52_19800 [Ochrobactrum ciceri]|uniref:Uncharacterized protein n=1 Tax=Brucella ciceri TaxID=391287 RepID=A0ABX1DZQ1_9HYPH|nr:hypothetical protein [Brucella ciceri]